MYGDRRLNQGTHPPPPYPHPYPHPCPHPFPHPFPHLIPPPIPPPHTPPTPYQGTPRASLPLCHVWRVSLRLAARHLPPPPRLCTSGGRATECSSRWRCILRPLRLLASPLKRRAGRRACGCVSTHLAHDSALARGTQTVRAETLRVANLHILISPMLTLWTTWHFDARRWTDTTFGT